MVVDHAGGLHVGVDDGGTNEVEAAFFEVFADLVREWGVGWGFADIFPVVNDGCVVDPAPEVVIERTAFINQLERGDCIAAG